MNQSSLISVVIPLYSQENYIAETINSVLKQTYQNFEIIVIDDGSTDRSAEIVKNIQDSRIQYFYQSNSGLPAIARNKGIALAKGEWIAFLDHDDLWKKEKLKLQMEVIEKDNTIKLVCGNMRYLKGKEGHLGGRVLGFKKDHNISFLEMIYGNQVLTSTVLVKKEFLDEFGGFNEAKELIAIEDYDLWLKISKKYPIFYQAQILAYYRVCEESTCGGKLKELKRLKKYRNFYLKENLSNVEKILLNWLNLRWFFRYLYWRLKLII